MTPPSRRPSAPPPAETAEYTPRARLRAFPSANVSASNDRAVGATTAPPIPCTTRAMMSIVEVVARPPANEPMVKRSVPPMNMRRRPYRSPARPPSRRRPPKAMAYAFTTHSRLVAVKCSDRWIDGSATLTMATSSTTISWATAMTASANPRRRGCGAVLILSLLCDPKPKVFVDADEPELQPLVPRKRRRGGGIVDDLRLDQCVISPEIGDNGPTGRQHIQVPGGVLAECPWHDKAVARPELRPRWCRMPRMGIQRRPAIRRITGLMKRAMDRTVLRVRGPRLIEWIGGCVVVICEPPGTE